MQFVIWPFFVPSAKECAGSVIALFELAMNAVGVNGEMHMIWTLF